MKQAKGIPTVITVSRQTGKVTDVTRTDIKAEDFRKTCKELMKSGKERKEADE